MLREVMERWSIHPLALGYSFHFWVFGPYSITLGIWAISGLGNIVNNAANLLAGVFCEALYAFLLGVYLDTWIEGVLGFSRVCPSLSITQASWFHHSEITTALTEKFFKEASNQGFETWNSTFYGEESNFLDSRSGKNRVGTVFPGRRIWCWWTCKGTAAPEELCTERVFEGGQFFLCLIQHIVAWAGPKLPASGTSICLGFCIHGNTCFTYHFISNNGKLNTWHEAMSGFRLEGGRRVRLCLQVATCQTKCLMQST